eukprot:scaffold1152_cov235-Pinguiococcus_pyrenoidosus.AAC.4
MSLRWWTASSSKLAPKTDRSLPPVGTFLATVPALRSLRRLGPLRPGLPATSYLVQSLYSVLFVVALLASCALKPPAGFLRASNADWKLLLGYAPGAKARNNMTTDERQQLQALKDRDNELDAKYLNRIGEGLDYLQEKAEGFSERLKEHDQRIDEIQTKTDEVSEASVGLKALHPDTTKCVAALRSDPILPRWLKDTLKHVRGSDKICVDIMCILVMLGLLGVLIQLLTSND